MRLELWAALWALFCAIICLFAIRHVTRKSRRMLIAVQQALDNAIAGDLQAERYDESLNGAILERLNQLVTMAGAQRNRALRERDDIMALISNITHQVRTPLAGIMLYGGMLREQEAEPSCAMLADRILRQAEKMEFFMKELVRTSYAEQEMLKMQPEKIAPEELITAACQNAELSSMKKGIVIRQLPLPAPKGRQNPGTETSASLLCAADRRWTVEALDNVLDNAVKYAPENSEITVRAIPYESFLCIEVADQGPGIPEEEQAKIWNRFYRSPSSLRTPGFGIGLYLVREIIGRQGGYVQVKSAPGQGSVFCLYLPRNLSNLSHLKKN